MSGLPQPSAEVGMKLACLVVHADEAMSPGGHDFDISAFRALLQDADVRSYIHDLAALNLLPVKRA